MSKTCNLGIWPMYNGRDITIAFTHGHSDDAVDLFGIDISQSEALLLAKMLEGAAACTDLAAPSMVLETLSIHEGLCPPAMRRMFKKGSDV